jgi:hypothetical protein
VPEVTPGNEPEAIATVAVPEVRIAPGVPAGRPGTGIGPSTPTKERAGVGSMPAPGSAAPAGGIPGIPGIGGMPGGSTGIEGTGGGVTGAGARGVAPPMQQPAPRRAVRTATESNRRVVMAAGVPQGATTRQPQSP